MSVSLGNQRAASGGAPRQTAPTPRPSTDTLPAAAARLGLTTDELRAWFEHGGSAGAIARLLGRRPNIVASLVAGWPAGGTVGPALRGRSAARQRTG